MKKMYPSEEFETASALNTCLQARRSKTIGEPVIEYATEDINPDVPF
jgi:hypothetical protein